MGVKPTTLVITVSGAGTRAQVTTSNIYATKVYFEPLTSVTGYCYFGDSTVSATSYMAARTVAQGTGFLLDIDGNGKASSAAGGGEINLSTLWVDAQQAGARVMVTYIQRVGSV